MTSVLKNSDCQPKLNYLLALVCMLGPALVALVPMAVAPALPAMALYFQDVDSSDLFAQMVMTTPAIMIIVFAPISGILSERYGVRLNLLTGLFLYIVFGFSGYFISDATLLIISRLLLGLAGGAVLTNSLILIGSSFSGHHRELLLGLATSLASIFAALALIFGGNMVDALGWRSSFMLYLIAAPVMIIAWFCVKSTPPIAKAKTAEKSNANSYSHKALIPLWPFYAVLILFTIGMFSPSIQGPFSLEMKGIHSASEKGLILSLTSICAVFSSALFGYFRRYFSSYTILLIDLFTMASGFILLSIATDTYSLGLACAIIGIGAGLSEPSIASILLDRTKIHIHGLAMGLVVSALNAGQFINPLIMNFFKSMSNIDSAFMMLGLIFSLVLFIAYIRRPTTDNRSDPLSKLA